MAFDRILRVTMKIFYSLLIVFAFVSPLVCAQETSLKTAFADDFVVGAALNEDQATGNLPQATELVEKQFNTITPENLLKWESIHPELDKYNFEPADKFVEFGEKNNMFIVGHTLVWHNQTPSWVFEDKDGKPLSREALLERLRDHIHTVVGRYQGRVDGWDVVNEAIETEKDESQGKWRETRWREIIGPDYIEKAFEYAHEADPDAELYYNDYDEWKPGKLQYFTDLVKNLQAKGIRIDGIGLQGHWGLDYPSTAEIDHMLTELSKLDVKLMITELDINVLPQPSRNAGADINARFAEDPSLNPYPKGLPPELEQQLADRYAEIFRLFHKHRDHLDRVTFWGVDDGQSWRNYWPIRGRTNYPLLFDREYQPKPAYDAVIKTASDAP
jgi:endo-1,4-beta-xylanase